MNISNRNIQALQIPNKDNKFHAVYEVCLTTPSGQTVCAVGEAKGKDETEIKGLLQLAEEDAHARAEAMLPAVSHKDADSTSSYDKWSNESPLSAKNFYKNIPSVKNPGGGKKPASSKQLEWIRNLCNDKGIDAEAYVLEKFGTDVSSLVGSQADQIIKELS